MRYQYSILAEIQELWQYHLNGRGIHNHGIIDAGQLFYFKGDRYSRVHKNGKPVCDLSLPDLNRTDLYDLIIHRRKSRCLDIKYDKICIQILSLISGNDLLEIIYQIGFHSIYDLKEILLIRTLVTCFDPLCLFCLPQILPHMIGIRKGLHNPMIRNGNRRVSPFIGSFYDILGFGYAIHITHLGVAVKLHPLLHTGITS